MRFMFPGPLSTYGPQYRTREAWSNDPNLSLMPDGSYHYSRRPRTPLEAHRIRQEAFTAGNNWAHREARRRGWDDEEPNWEWAGDIGYRHRTFDRPVRAFSMGQSGRGYDRRSTSLGLDMRMRSGDRRNGNGLWGIDHVNYAESQPYERRPRRGWW